MLIRTVGVALSLTASYVRVAALIQSHTKLVVADEAQVRGVEVQVEAEGGLVNLIGYEGQLLARRASPRQNRQKRLELQAMRSEGNSTSLEKDLPSEPSSFSKPLDVMLWAAEVSLHAVSSRFGKLLGVAGSRHVADGVPDAIPGGISDAIPADISDAIPGDISDAIPGTAIGSANKTAQLFLGDEPEKVPLPPWVQVLLGVATMLVVAGLIQCIRARCTAVVPRNADADRLDVVIEETREKVRELKLQLERRHALLDAGVGEDADPEGVSERELARREAQKAEERIQEITEAADRLVEQREQIVAKAILAKQSFIQGVGDARERVEDFARVESAEVYHQVQEAAATREIPTWEPPEWLENDEDSDFVKIPPIIQIFAGMTSTSRMRFYAYMNAYYNSLNTIIIGVCIGCIACDWKRSCDDICVKIWQVGMLAIASLDWFGRNVIMWWVTTDLASLRRMREEMEKQDMMRTGNNLVDAIAFLRRGSLSFFEAYFRFRSIVESHLQTCLSALSFIAFAWGGFGLYITVMHIIVDTLACQQRGSLIWMYTYTGLFTMSLTWSLMAGVLAITQTISSSSSVGSAFIKVAMKLDDDLNRGYPVWLTIIQSYVLKNSSDELGLSEKHVKDDIRKLHHQMEEANETMERTRRIEQRLQELEAEQVDEAQFMDNVQRTFDQAMEHAKPLIGLIASNVKMDPHPEAGRSLEHHPGGAASKGASPYSARPPRREAQQEAQQGRASMSSATSGESAENF